MRKAVSILVLVCILACGAALLASADGSAEKPKPTAATHSKKRLAVVPFDTPSDYYDTPLSTGLCDMIITALVKSGSFDVIERQHLDALLKERNLAAKGMIDPTTAVEAGKILGVDYILGGKVTEFGIKEKKSGLGGLAGGILGGVDLRKSTARVKMDVRLIDCTTAKILIADTGEGEEKESGVVFAGGALRSLILAGRFDTKEWAESRIGKATRKAVDQVCGKVVAFFPARGNIVAVMTMDGKRYAILDLGKFSGVEVGKEFKVIRETDVKDDSGAVVWSEKSDVGAVRVVEVQNERSKAEIISEKSPIQKGDTFEIPPAKAAEQPKEK